MTISLDLPPDEADLLKRTADELGLPPEDLARAVLSSALRQPREDFRRAADYVLQKNRELYRRLA